MINNFSKTAYRTLLILNSLIESNQTRENLVKYLEKLDPQTKKLSKDSITLYINELRNFDFCISRPHRHNGFVYELKAGSDFCGLTKDDIDFLFSIKLLAAEEGDWEFILDFNDFVDKISFLIEKNVYDYFLNSPNQFLPFSLSENQKIKQLEKHSNKKNALEIRYISPNSGENVYEVIPQKITLESLKMYLWCINLKDSQMQYLRIDRIKSFDLAKKRTAKIYPPEIKAIYKLSHQSVVMFSIDSSEKVIEAKNDELLIEANVINEFWFFQRLLSFGKDCEILEPKEFREKFSLKLRNMIQNYE